MGILSGDINTLKVGEKINLSSVVDFVEDKTDGRWSPSPAETTSEPVPAESAQNSSVETEGIELASSELTPTIITGDVAEQYLASYPGGNEAFNADLVRYIESIQGADPKGGWMAKMFAPDAGKANAFDAMKQFRVSELKEVNDFSPKERQALLRDKNIRVDDFKAWMSYVALLETSDRIKPWNNITLGEAVKRGFIDTKINPPRSNTADGILT